jgi:hypothetical protein
MKLDGEHERIRERFRSLRSDDEMMAPPFERTWREAVSRAEPATKPATHALRFAVAILLLCVATAGFTALLLPSERTAVEQPPTVPAKAPVVEQPVAPDTTPVVVKAEDTNRPRKPEPIRRTTRSSDDQLQGKCASCPTLRKPRTSKPDRRKDESPVEPDANSCADC